MLKGLTSETVKKVKKLVPEMEIISLARVVAHFNTDVWPSGWAQHQGTLHQQHSLSVGYVQAHYKNHIMDFAGLRAFEANIRNLQALQYHDVANQFKHEFRVHSSRVRNLFIMAKKPIEYQHQILNSPLMKSQNYRKILCYPKDEPLIMGKELQAFCRSSSIQALGLKEINLNAALSYVLRKEKLSVLVHGVVLNDISPYLNKYEEKEGVRAPYIPQQLLMFCNKVQKIPAGSKPMPTLPQLLLNYMNRVEFSQTCRTETKGFDVQRFTHLREVHRNMEHIAIEEGLDNDQ